MYVFLSWLICQNDDFSFLARFTETQLRMQISRKNDACSSGARDNELEIASLEGEETDLCFSRT